MLISHHDTFEDAVKSLTNQGYTLERNQHDGYYYTLEDKSEYFAVITVNLLTDDFVNRRNQTIEKWNSIKGENRPLISKINYIVIYCISFEAMNLE